MAINDRGCVFVFYLKLHVVVVAHAAVVAVLNVALASRPGGVDDV
jgi:hypothetical protein